MNELKICRKCHQEKRLDEFSKNKHKKDLLQAECKVCRKKMNNDDYQKNKKAILKKAKEKYAYNPSKIRERQRAWCVKNPQKRRAIKQRRRAREIGANGSHTYNDIENILIFQKNKCVICKVSIKKKYHVDHVIPLSRGGSNDKDNIQLLCPSCNMSKGAKEQTTFIQERGYLI